MHLCPVCGFLSHTEPIRLSVFLIISEQLLVSKWDLTARMDELVITEHVSEG